MGERFIRCPFCGRPHEASVVACPTTGRRLPDPDDTRNEPLAGQAQARPLRVPGPAPERIPQRPRHSEGKTAIASSDPVIGQMLDGKYLVRSILGEGGMGTVYEAEHVALARAVAVKVLHPQQARKTVAVKRFHQEARAAGAIGHPNICEVFDLGMLPDGSPYLVMERLLGRTVADRIANEGGLPFDDVVDIVSQVLAGLAVAHEKGIVHRDIKPENVFLCERPGFPTVAKLLDFGVSKMLSPVLSGERDEDMDLTRTGMVMGTPFYMSPEQARGDRDLDGRVDLFACGVILYEVLTGRRPFLAANYNALLLQILTATPKPLRELRPSVPPGFERVVARALERDRTKRYQKALDFQRDLLALRERPAVSVRAGAPVPSAGEVARQSFGGVRPPAAPRAQVSGNQPARRLREVVPPPVTPSSVDIPLDYDEHASEHYRRDSDRPMEFGDDSPTEVTSDPAFYEDEDAATQVRGDGVEMLNALRALRGSQPPPRPAAGVPAPPRPSPPRPAAGVPPRPASFARSSPPPSQRVPPPPPPGAKLPAVGGFDDDAATRIDPSGKVLDSGDDPTHVIEDSEDLRAKLRS